MREINLAIIHCADTPNGKHFTVEDIDDWHQERGFNRSESYVQGFNKGLHHIGYHFVIYVDGSVHTGRSDAEVGAHAQGYNSNSIGICMIGRDKFTTEQWASLEALLNELKEKYPKLRVKGHYQVDMHGKTCPNFDVPNYIISGKTVDPDDIMVV